MHTSAAYRHGYSAGPTLPEFGATVGAHVCAREHVVGPVAPTCVLSTMQTNVATLMPSTSVGADTRPTYVSLGVPLSAYGGH